MAFRERERAGVKVGGRRERGRRREREKERYQCEREKSIGSSRTCPDQELNPRDLSVPGTALQPAEPRLPGWPLMF